MFQYALARRLQLESGTELKFDLSWFDNLREKDTPRELGLDKFNIPIVEATDDEINAIEPGLITVFLKKINNRYNTNYHYTYHNSDVAVKNNYYLDGYYQSFRYFNSIRDVLLADFKIKDGLSQIGLEAERQILSSKYSTSLHIRRGDYVNQSGANYHGLCDAKYYNTALAKLNKDNLTGEIFVFSDDIEWAKKNLILDQSVTFVSRPDLNYVEEMILMSKCHNQIIANSTFSWWAAWLNENSQKKVISPRRWLAAKDVDIKDLILPTWETI
ncbi:MAG: alpha-1,2-fucosyltransferase [Candidatus Falkowbacteria bacterium]